MRRMLSCPSIQPPKLSQNMWHPHITKNLLTIFHLTFLDIHDLCNLGVSPHRMWSITIHCNYQTSQYKIEFWSLKNLLMEKTITMLLKWQSLLKRFQKHPNSKNVTITCQTLVRAAQASSLLLALVYMKTIHINNHMPSPRRIAQLNKVARAAQMSRLQLSWCKCPKTISRQSHVRQLKIQRLKMNTCTVCSPCWHHMLASAVQVSRLQGAAGENQNIAFHAFSLILPRTPTHPLIIFISLAPRKLGRGQGPPPKQAMPFKKEEDKKDMMNNIL